MNDNKFDLKVENYTCSELEELFEVSYPYTIDQIHSNKEKLNLVLINNNTLDKDRSNKIITFLNSAALKLINIMNTKECGNVIAPSQNGHSGSPFIGHNHINDIHSNMNAMPTNTLMSVTTHSSTGRSSGDTTAPKGILNPINTHTITRILNIDSQFRDNYFSTRSSDFMINLPTKLERVTQITLQEAQLPVTWFSISSAKGNNSFYLHVALPKALDNNYDKWYKNPPLGSDNVTIIEKDILITIPDGNYTMDYGADTDKDSIGYAVNSAISMALKVPINYPRICFRSDKKTGRGIFSEQPVYYDVYNESNCMPPNNNTVLPQPWSNHPTEGNIEKIYVKDTCESSMEIVSRYTCYPLIRLLGVKFNINLEDAQKQDYISPLQLTLGWGLGFRIAEYQGLYKESTLYTQTNDYVSWISGAIENKNTFISEGCILIKGPAYGYIVVNDFNNNVSQGFTQSYADSLFPSADILSKVSLQDDYLVGSLITVLGVTTTRTFFGPVDITKLRIRFMDEYARIIDFNNMDWNLTLSFTCVYDKT